MSNIQWTPQQRSVFQEFGSGRENLAVIARAGSGKTTTIVEGLRYVPDKVRRICFAAFNRKIADEIRERVPQGVDVKTVHSIGFGAIKKGLNSNAVIVEDKTLHIANRILLGKSATADDIPTETSQKPRMVKGARQLAKLVGFAKNMLLTESTQIAKVAIHRGFDEFYEADEMADYAIDVIDACGEITSIIDFDDMVWMPWLHNLKPFQFDLIVGDEIQDWNAASLYIIGSSFRAGGRLIGVGDDFQSIYQFRGADARAIPNLIHHFTAKTLPLTITYRCPKAVVELAKKIVPDIQAAPEAPEGIVDACTIHDVVNRAKPGDFVLSRKNAPLMGMCIRLVRKGIPACIAGRDVGRNLIEVIDRSSTTSVIDLLKWSQDIMTEEVRRYSELGSDERVQMAIDRHELLVAAAEGAGSIGEIHNRINTLFRDDDDMHKVVCSSIHKAKGLERDNVFLLNNTFANNGTVEDRNLRYVGITRAKKQLTIVGG